MHPSKHTAERYPVDCNCSRRIVTIRGAALLSQREESRFFGMGRPAQHLAEDRLLHYSTETSFAFGAPPSMKIGVSIGSSLVSRWYEQPW